MAALGIAFSCIHSSLAVLAPRHRLTVAQVEHLATAAIAKDGDALAAQVVSQVVNLQDIVHCGAFGQVHSLGDGVVCVLLEGGLDLDVLLGWYVQSRYKQVFEILG
jgi:hypothetical protein